jgi:hypothetical protein
MVLWAESAEQIIAKARAYLGSEKALQAVRTIHFTGALEIDAHNLGRLVKTETESRREIRAVGEIIGQGVRFPRKVINKVANGQTTRIIFDRIILNEPIPAGEFAVPAVPRVRMESA